MKCDRIIYDRKQLEQSRQDFYYCQRISPSSKCVKNAFSFEKLLELFDDASLKVCERAAKIGITISNTHKLYNAHFRVLYGGRSMRERYNTYHKVSQKRKAREWNRFLRQPWVHHFFEEAAKAGHIIEPPAEVVPVRRAVMVSHHLCMITPITTIRHMNHSPWARVIVHPASLQCVFACILPVMVSDTELHTLVVPAQDLLEFMQGKSPNESRLNIPLMSSLAGYKRISGFRTYRYNNAWELIPHSSARQ